MPSAASIPTLSTSACHSERLAALLLAILYLDRAARSRGTLRSIRSRARLARVLKITKRVGAPSTPSWLGVGFANSPFRAQRGIPIAPRPIAFANLLSSPSNRENLLNLFIPFQK
jgi:hypothetical protein